MNKWSGFGRKKQVIDYNVDYKYAYFLSGEELTE